MICRKQLLGAVEVGSFTYPPSVGRRHTQCVVWFALSSNSPGSAGSYTDSQVPRLVSTPESRHFPGHKSPAREAAGMHLAPVSLPPRILTRHTAQPHQARFDLFMPDITPHLNPHPIPHRS